MNIVYGVSGEGLGHVFEAWEIARLLQEDGHAVKLLTFGDRACRSLARFEPTRIEGVHLHFGPAGPFRIAAHPAEKPRLPALLPEKRAAAAPGAGGIPSRRVFLTAYEPFTTFAARRLRKPLISMDNQNDLCRLRREQGTDAFAFYLARWVTRVVTAGADEYIVKSLERGPRGGRRVHVVSPVIQREIRSLRPTHGGPVLVYLTKPNPRVIEILKSLPEKFVVYGQQRAGPDGNLLHRTQGPAFLGDLAACKAIIGTTGFSLIADSLYLRKPYFGVPLKGQFEQMHNARFLARSGLGDYSEEVSRPRLEQFLRRLPDFRQKLAAHDFDPTEQERTLRRLLAGIAARTEPVPAGEFTVLSPGT